MFGTAIRVLQLGCQHTKVFKLVFKTAILAKNRRDRGRATGIGHFQRSLTFRFDSGIIAVGCTIFRHGPQITESGFLKFNRRIRCRPDLTIRIDPVVAVEQLAVDRIGRSAEWNGRKSIRSGQIASHIKGRKGIRNVFRRCNAFAPHFNRVFTGNRRFGIDKHAIIASNGKSLQINGVIADL